MLESKKTMQNNEKVVVEPFSGADAHMQLRHYIQQTIESKPDAIILHIGTNELRNSKKTDLKIANEILGLAKLVEKHKINVTIFGLIAREDGYEERRSRVDLILTDVCFEKISSSLITQILSPRAP